MKEDFLLSQLEKRREQHAFRALRLPTPGMTDFCSNDYLGLARSAAMQESMHALMQERPYMHGSAGSRLLAGNYTWIEEAETMLATFHQSTAALIFNSGYDANVGLFSSVPQKGDTIIYDQLIHASIRDGIRLSKAQSFSFLHNDLEDLKKKLQHAEGNVFVAIESVYSMDGDMAPLKEISALCENAHLIVDEAHATGVIGEKGEGYAQHLGVPCFARIHTFGKAVGCHGAVIVGSQALRDYLINFARSFIYTTALPAPSIAAIMASYDLFPHMSSARKHLSVLIRKFQSAGLPSALISETPIQVVLTPGNEVARKVAAELQLGGMDVRAILHPTVPKGGERLRIVLHSYNTLEEVDHLLNTLITFTNRPI
jgi:8-amino-7-oxononanoate synthase